VKKAITQESAAAAVAQAWRTIAYHDHEGACTADRVAAITELPVDRKGLPLS